MQMPGRHGFATESGDWHGSYAFSIPPYLFVDHRAGNTPLEYVASQTIELSNGFLTGAGSDNYVAYITDSASMATADSAYQLVANGYRYGFNGKEKDDEVKGEGNELDYGVRIQDTRLGRFLSIDPLIKQYPELTPYQFASNTPLQAIDLDGLEATYNKQNNVYFVILKNADVSFIVRQSEKSFTQSAADKNSNWSDFSINTQQYEATSASSRIAYGWGPTSPQSSSDYQAQGFTVEGGKKIAGRSSPETFNFSQTSNNCLWNCGKGDVPPNSYTGFGGGIPVYVNGLKYGEKNIYSKNAPAGLPEVGDPGQENKKYLVQRSNSGFSKQNNEMIGKTVVGYNSKSQEWNIVVQPNDVKGMTLDAIRDKLISKGCTSILSFDGSTSSTLVHDDKTLVTPSERKNNTITTGATFSAPQK